MTQSKWDLDAPRDRVARDHAAARTGEVHYGNSRVAVAAGVLLVVCGALLVLFYGFFVFLITVHRALVVDELAPYTQSPEQMAANMGFFLAFPVVLGVVQAVAAIGVFRHKTWARWLGVTIGVVGLFMGPLFLWTYSPGGIANLVALLAYGFILFGLAGHGEHFRPRPERAYPTTF